ncbi:MAG: FliM/FliN family flagellar motor switch protein [Desulfovibrionaceae bacterium]
MSILHLPKVSFKQVQDMNSFFKGAACAVVTVAEEEYLVVFETEQGITRWWGTIIAQIGEDEVYIFLDTPPPLESVLPGVWPEESVILPESVVLIALNTILENALDAFSVVLGKPIVLKNILLTPKKEQNIEDVLYFSFIHAASSKRIMCAINFAEGPIPSVFLAQLATLFHEAAPLAQDASMLPVPYILEVGYTVMKQSLFINIEVDDIIVFDEFYPSGSFVKLRSPDGTILKGQWSENSITIVGMEENMNENDVQINTGMIENIPVRIVMEIGDVLLPIHEVRSIQNGYVFTTNKTVASPVSLKIHGKEVGSGELINIEGTIGVRVTDIHIPTMK